MRQFLLLVAFTTTAYLSTGQDFNQYLLSSNHPDEVSNTELEFLKHEIGESQVVFLGEQNHGDGGTMLAKTTLIRYLIEEMGFSVIAFEGDFLTLNDSSLTLDQKWSTLPAMWKYSDQLIPLYELIKEHQIDLAGFDLIGTKAFKEFYWNKAREHTDFSQEDIDQAVQAVFYDTKASKRAVKEVFRITPLLLSQTDGFDHQLLRSFQLVTDAYQQLPMRNRVGLEKYRERDTQMGQNLSWLMDNLLSDRKVIVWSANYHIARNPNEIESHKDWRFRSGQLESMGNKFEELSNLKSYRIAITSFGGEYTDWEYDFSKSLEIKGERHNDNSLELLLAEQGVNYSFVPLRNISMDYSLSGFVHKAFRGNWSNVFDAVFFINTMTPSTFIQRETRNQ